MRPDRLRLLDAIEQTQLISKFAEQGREAFINDDLVQSAILHRLALLGEACRAVSAEVREAHADIPWGPNRRVPECCCPPILRHRS